MAVAFVPKRSHMRMTTTLALVLVVLSGRVLDRTTGQPLPNVHIAAASGQGVTTDSGGRYTLRGLRPGRLTLMLESADVPPQRLQVRVSGKRAHVDLRACSTTLDYSCGAQTPGAGAPPGAG